MEPRASKLIDSLDYTNSLSECLRGQGTFDVYPDFTIGWVDANELKIEDHCYLHLVERSCCREVGIKDDMLRLAVLHCPLEKCDV